MNAAAVLTSQIKREQDRLLDAAQALQGRDPAGLAPGVAERYGTVRARFLKVLQDLDAKLEGLLPVGSPSAHAWTTFRDIRAGVNVMAQETLALLQAWMGRDDPVLAEACDLADALLVELGAATGTERAQLAILAGEESFTPRTELIRVRFTDTAVWSLPVVAHEFGHLLVQEHRALGGQWASLPFQDLFEGKADEAQRRELFSDLFAIYTTGPAFAACCLLTRFDPSTDLEEEPGATHPSDAKRAYFILAALDRLRSVDSTLTKTFGDMHERLSELWTSSLHHVDGPLEPDDRMAKELRARLTAFLTRLDAEVGGARYGSARWSHAKRISAGFSSGADVAQLIEDGDAVADVLNGAWHWRVHHWAAYESNSRRHDGRALQLLKAVARA